MVDLLADPQKQSVLGRGRAEYEAAWPSFCPVEAAAGDSPHYRLAQPTATACGTTSAVTPVNGRVEPLRVWPLVDVTIRVLLSFGWVTTATQKKREVLTRWFSRHPKFDYSLIAFSFVDVFTFLFRPFGDHLHHRTHRKTLSAL